MPLTVGNGVDGGRSAIGSRTAAVGWKAVLRSSVRSVAYKFEALSRTSSFLFQLFRHLPA